MLRFIILGASALALGLSTDWVFMAGSLRAGRTATELPINIAKPPPYPETRGHLVTTPSSYACWAYRVIAGCRGLPMNLGRSV